ncbi:MAG: hypothetical protein ACI392_01025 [Paludibacteraceae bacterium]
MMKHTKHLLVLWAALLLGAGNAWGAELRDTLNCSTGTVSNNTMTFSSENNYFTIVHAKGDGSNFAAYSIWRVYAKNTITITAGSGVSTITKIEIVHSGTYYGTISSSVGDVTMATSSGGTSTITITAANTTSVTLTNTSSSQLRCTTIYITYESEETTNYFGQKLASPPTP